MAYSCKSYKKYRPVKKDGSKCRCTRLKYQADYLINATSQYMGYQIIEVYPAFKKEFVIGMVLPTIYVDMSDLFV